jgi:hypothetical protein
MRRETLATGQHEPDRGFQRLGRTGLGQQTAHLLGQAAFRHRRQQMIGQHQHAQRLRRRHNSASIGQPAPLSAGIPIISRSAW